VRFVTVVAAAAAFGGVVLVVALFSKRIRSTCFSAPLGAMVLGIALSPFATGAVDITFWADRFYFGGFRPGAEPDGCEAGEPAATGRRLRQVRL
jgi:hypothetical protein